MAFSPKDWRDLPDHSTPITAAALEDLETRVTDYADTLPLGDTFNNTFNIDLDPGVATTQFLDVWGSEATPEAVTDWGPIIEGLVTGGANALWFDAHDFPFSTFDVRGGAVRFAGVLGRDWFSPGASGYTRLICKEAGPGTAILVNRALIQDIAISYDDAFTGTLVKVKEEDQAFLEMQRCHIGYAAQGQDITAAIGVDLNKGILNTFQGCVWEGCLTGVQGFPSAGGWSNGAKFDACTFQGQTQYSVLNPGDQWAFDTCIFESVGAVDHTVESHIRMEKASTYGAALTVRDCTHWDASDTDTIWIEQVQDAGWLDRPAYIRLDNCVEHNLSNPSVKLLGAAYLSFSGGGYGNIDIGDGSIAQQKKFVVDLGGFACISLTGQNTGHGPEEVRAIDIFPDRPDGDQGIRSKVWAEIADNSSHTPTVTVPAGAPASFAITQAAGNDKVGRVGATYSGGGTSGTGSIIQVAFDSPPPLNGAFGVQPRVSLTPLNATAAGAGAYHAQDEAHPEYFRIAITTGVGDSTTPQWEYNVTWGNA